MWLRRGEQGGELSWRFVSGEYQGERGSSRTTRNLELDSAHDRGTTILPTLHLSQSRLGWGRGAKTYTENSHLVRYIPALHGTRSIKPAEFTHIIQVPSDPLESLLETQAIWVQKYWFQLVIRCLWSSFLRVISLLPLQSFFFFHFHSTELWIWSPDNLMY